MAGGYVKMWRRALDSPVFADAGLWHIASWCIMRAAWKPTSVPIRTGRGLHVVELKVGQFIFGRDSAEKQLNRCGKSVERALKSLEKLDFLSRKTSNHFTIVTVCNFESYQGDDGDSVQQNVPPYGQPTVQPSVLPTDQQTSTNKKINNKEVKKGRSNPSDLDAVEIPETLRNDQFKTAWSDWTIYRQQLKKPLTPKGAEMALKHLAKIGAKRAIASIEYTMAKGWQGLQEPESSKGQEPEHVAEVLTHDEIEALNAEMMGAHRG